MINRRDFLIFALSLTASVVPASNNQEERTNKRHIFEKISQQVDDYIGDDVNKAKELIDLSGQFLDEGKPYLIVAVIQMNAVARYKLLAKGKKEALKFLDNARKNAKE